VNIHRDERAGCRFDFKRWVAGRFVRSISSSATVTSGYRAPRERAAIAVGLLYAAQTVLGLHMHDILGIIPVDSRDRIVHPAISILGLIAAGATQRDGNARRSQRPHWD